MMKPSREARWEWFYAALSPTEGDKILDIGAGRGEIASRVQERSKGVEVYAVEPDEGRVSMTQRNHPGVKSAVGKAESLPFADGYFDRVYMTLALHHFDDLQKALAEIARVTRGGGLVLILEINPSSWEGRLFHFLGRLTGERVNPVEVDELVAMVRTTGSFAAASYTRQGSEYLLQTKRT